jgi:putative OPT family oligopeptide transporter
MSVEPPPAEPNDSPRPAAETAAPGAFRPLVPDSVSPPELTWSAVLLGSLLGIVFGASSLYLFLKVGMTVSASIPVAVLSITIFRALSKAFGFRRATILENNIVQTSGSAGESIAFGVGATMPALMILGYDMAPMRVMMVSVLGGILGILMMIPLRRAFIVKQHGTLPYPEGTACAKILVAGEQGGANAKTVFTGFGLAFVYQTLMEVFHLWPKEPEREITGISGYSKGVVSAEVAPALLGVGYIIGTRTASIMVAGGILASLVLVPAIAFFGSLGDGTLAPGGGPISGMSAGEIRGSYVRYIGAGAVAAGGIISMVRALPLILGGLAGSVRAMGAKGGAAGSTGRTGRDMPIWIVALGALGLVGAISGSDLIPTDTAGRIAGALMILLFGFLFVTVSSRLTGEIGSSSNPISGMTIATLLLTCLIFVLLGWVGEQYRVTALSIAAIVCIASSNGGTTSQDLKTGHLIGGTPWKQQVAILAGAITSAVVIGFTLLLLNGTHTDYITDPGALPRASAPAESLADLPAETSPADGKSYKVWWVTEKDGAVPPGRYYVDPESGAIRQLVNPGIGGREIKQQGKAPVEKFNPPQPELFAVIIDGIMSGNLPWGLVVLGAMLAVVVQLTGVSALAFAVGVYLPLSTTMPIFVGGLIRYVVDRSRKMSAEESDSSPAVLMSSGLIAGGSIAGILIALLAVFLPTADYFSTEGLPTAVAASADLQRTEADGEEQLLRKKGPDGESYMVWAISPAKAGELSAPSAPVEPGEYLVDTSGKAAYRVEPGSVLDLSMRFLPRGWRALTWPALAAFAVLIAALLWTGLRGETVAEALADVPGADLSRDGEASGGGPVAP